jgi:type III secretion protein L
VADRVLYALRRAFTCLGEGDQITVRCSPADVGFLEEAFKNDPGDLAASRRVRIIPDDGVRPNGCLVETELGVIDARVEQQLAVLRGALRNTLDDSRAESFHVTDMTASVSDSSPQP